MISVLEANPLPPSSRTLPFVADLLWPHPPAAPAAPLVLLWACFAHPFVFFRLLLLFSGWRLCCENSGGCIPGAAAVSDASHRPVYRHCPAPRCAQGQPLCVCVCVRVCVCVCGVCGVCVCVEFGVWSVECGVCVCAFDSVCQHGCSAVVTIISAVLCRCCGRASTLPISCAPLMTRAVLPQVFSNPRMSLTDCCGLYVLSLSATDTQRDTHSLTHTHTHKHTHSLTHSPL